jgi:hypothetical protein
LTTKAGLFRRGYAYGVTVGDYNNDGFDGVFMIPCRAARGRKR